MGNKNNLDTFSKKFIELNFKTPTNFTIFFKEEHNNEILLKIEVHKIILHALCTDFFSELTESDDNFTLTIPKVNAIVSHAILCRIYKIENGIFRKIFLEIFFATVCST